MERVTGQYFLNTDLREDELREQTRLLCEAGYEVIYLHSRAGLKTPYLSEGWFRALRTVIDELRRHSVKFAIWDEDNYPSGNAGDRIVNDFPELASRELLFTVIEAKKGERIQQFFTEKASFLRCFGVYGESEIIDLSRHCGTLRSKWGKALINNGAYSPEGQLGFPHRRRSMNSLRFAINWEAERDCRIVAVEIAHVNARHKSDLLNPETTLRLLEYTHEAYKETFGEQVLRSECAASFLDEPSPAGEFPWTRAFPTEFQAAHGYDLIAVLPHLALELGPQSFKIRRDYRDTLHRLVCGNYLQRLRGWLQQHGIASAGHLTRSEWLSYSNLRWPNELRCLKYLDIPCCDPLGAGIGKMGSKAHHIGIKTVSSAARLFGKKAAGADAFAVGGDTITLRDLQFMLNYHLVLGINYFNVHGLYYSLESERRDEAPPSLFYQHSEWPLMPEFLAYMKKRCRELGEAEYDCNLAMLYPSTALQCRRDRDPSPDAALHQLAELLLSRQRDFELIDELTLSEQTPADFVQQRPFFLLAHAEWIESATAHWLEEYTAAGGTLFLEGPVPKLVDANGKSWNFAESCRAADFCSRIPAAELCGEGSEAVLIRQMRRNGKRLVFLFNRGSQSFSGTLNGKPLRIAPGQAGFEDELRPKPAPPRITPLNWQVKFEENSVPLHFWEYAGGNIELFFRQQIGLPPQNASEFTAKFFVSAPLELKLCVEEDMLARGEFRINGKPLEQFQKADFRDCREVECGLSYLLARGTEPTLNKISYRGSLFENAPYLRGDFRAEFPQGFLSFPVLSPAPAEFTIASPCDFRELGYGTYSGKVCYSAEFDIGTDGMYRLAFSQLHDSARIIIDGKLAGSLIAAPYELDLQLHCGKHRLNIELFNGAGNRDCLAGLPTGFRLEP